MQINISELVRQAQNGDRGACSKLYKLTFRSSYYLALRILGNESDAAEIVEKSYRRAFSSVTSLKNPESFEAWIKHITAAKSIDLLKQKNQLVFNGQADLPSPKIEDGDEFLPKGLEKSANAGKAINKIIDSLPDCQRAVAVLHYYNEMPVSYIAQMFGCTENDVRTELYSARDNIKKCIERMINRENDVYPSEGKPILALILKSASQQQNVEENMLRTIFVSATEGLVAAPVIETVHDSIKSEPSESNAAVYAPAVPAIKSKPPKASKSKELPEIFKKLSSLTQKQKITAIICAAVAVVLIIAGVIGIPKLVSKGKTDDSTNNADTVTEAALDTEMLNGIKQFEDVYDKILRECYAYEGDSWKEALYTFAYIDDNEIPDMIFMIHEADDDLGLVFMNGEAERTEETFSTVYLSHTLFGEKGSIVEIQDTINEDTQKTEFLSYREYKYVDGVKTHTKTLQYTYNDYSSEVKEEWLYSVNEKSQLLSGMEEFNEMLKEMLSGYKQIVAGYSVADYIEAEKNITDFIKKTSPVSYEYQTEVAVIDSISAELTTTNITPNETDYKWVESAVLNESFSLIENYNEKSCLIKMADTGYFGLIDLKGNIVIEPEYGHYFDYCSYGNGDTHYIMQDENRNDHIIDMNTFKVDPQIHSGHGANDDIIPAGFDDIDRFYNGLAAAKKNGKWGYVDKSYNSVVPFEYEAVEDRFIADDCRGFDGTYIPVKKNGKMGIINKQNQVVVPFEYSVIMHGDDGIFIAQKNGKWGFIGIGVEPTEPKKPVSAEKTPEWETNYLKTIKHEAFKNFNFILTDLDNNGVPDLILVMHRGTRGPITTVTMNGKFTDAYDEETGYFDYLYYSKEGKIATSSFYNYYTDGPGGVNSYRNLDECFSYSYYENGGIHDSDYVHRVTIYDRETDEVIGVRYYVVDENYNEVEISESDFNRVYKDITNNYTKAYETSVEDFKSSGNNLADYMQEF